MPTLSRWTPPLFYDTNSFGDAEPTQEQVALLKQRQHFLALLAHDLRNPIIASQRILTLMASGKLGDISEYHSNLLLKIGESNQALLLMINDVLENYRLDARPAVLNCMPVDLKALVNTCVAELEPLAQSKNITLVTSLKSINRIVADELAMRRVISNLVGNAIKYTAADGRIEISVLDQDNRAMLRVQDDGLGIADEDRQNMFSLFWQATSSDQAQGLGMGLFFCRQIIEAQRGTITCHSILGTGTTFEISLPYALKKDRPLVLIVDDSPLTGMVLQEFLKTLAVDAHLVHSGAQALLEAQQTDYDAFFMDMMMPGMDGVSSTRALRKSGVCKPILAYSSMLLLPNNDELKNAGFSDFLAKPVDSACLKRLVAKWILPSSPEPATISNEESASPDKPATELSAC